MVYPITYCWDCYETMTESVNVPCDCGHIQSALVLLWYLYMLDLFVEISAWLMIKNLLQLNQWLMLLWWSANYVINKKRTFIIMLYWGRSRHCNITLMVVICGCPPINSINVIKMLHFQVLLKAILNIIRQGYESIPCLLLLWPCYHGLRII